MARLWSWLYSVNFTDATVISDLSIPGAIGGVIRQNAAASTPIEEALTTMLLQVEAVKGARGRIFFLYRLPCSASQLEEEQSEQTATVSALRQLPSSTPRIVCP